MMKQPRKETCPACQGNGKVLKNDSIFEWGFKQCSACKGTGFIEILLPWRQGVAKGKSS